MSIVGVCAALSILVCVILGEFVSFLRCVEVFWWAAFVFASPSWQRPIRGFGMGRRNRGCARVVGIGVVGIVWARLSPMCGMEVMRAWWSL